MSVAVSSPGSAALGTETDRLRNAVEAAGVPQSAASVGVNLSRLIHELYGALREVLMERKNDPEAPVVSGDSVVHAISLLGQLPSTLSLPTDVGIDNDGYIALDWDYGPRQVLSVRISSDGTAYYAGLLGHSSFRGVEIASDGVPLAILQGIERVSHAARL